MGELSDVLRAKIERAMGGKGAEVYKTDIGDAGAVFMAKKLRGNTFVESLYLIGCGIGAAGARALAETLGEHNNTLKDLELGDNDSLGDDGAEAFALMLKKNTMLERLGLAQCCIGARGARALARTLGEHNSTLKELELADNDSLGDDGAEAFALMLEKNTTLEELHLGSCGIGARGARALGEALTENTALKYMNLSADSIADDGVEALAEALRFNESLKLLPLAQCGLTDIGASSLLAALRQSNSTLRETDLVDNPFDNDNVIDDELYFSIEKLLEENKAVVPASAERRARCLLFCCLKLAPTAHEHVVPSIGAVPVPVMQYAVEHAGRLHVAKRFEHGNAVAGQSSAVVRARSLSLSFDGKDFESAAARRRR